MRKDIPSELQLQYTRSSAQLASLTVYGVPFASLKPRVVIHLVGRCSHVFSHEARGCTWAPLYRMRSGRRPVSLPLIE